MSISDTIRAEIERQGLTAYAVAKLAGVGANVVIRFLSGERDITLATADKIATAWGLVLVRVVGHVERDAVPPGQQVIGYTSPLMLSDFGQARSRFSAVSSVPNRTASAGLCRRASRDGRSRATAPWAQTS